MKIDAISARYPSKKISNQDVIHEVRRRSEKIYDGDLDELFSKIDDLFQRAGIESRERYQKKESWYQIVHEAKENALKQAGCKARDIGCLIYCSVYRTMFEPSMAVLLAKNFEMWHAMAFDINEACAGWVRAVAVANHMLKSGFSKKIMIISNEAHHREDSPGYSAWQIKSMDDLEWAFPSFTIGAAATATILSADPENEWVMDFAAENEFADYCLLPTDLSDSCEYQMGEIDTLAHGAGVFTCYGQKLQMASYKKFYRFVKQSKSFRSGADIAFPHTQTFHAYKLLFSMLKCTTPLYSIFPKHGNIVTSSLPGTIADAYDAGVLKRGDKAFILIPASGLSMATMSFVF